MSHSSITATLIEWIPEVAVRLHRSSTLSRTRRHYNHRPARPTAFSLLSPGLTDGTPTAFCLYRQFRNGSSTFIADRWPAGLLSHGRRLSTIDITSVDTTPGLSINITKIITNDDASIVTLWFGRNRWV